MSSSVPPPPPPPSGPPSGPPPEYLTSGGGEPAPSGRPRRGGLKRGLIVGGGALGLVAAGVGAWAAYSFMATGDQPAQALPADTLGYVSIDLDPNGGQKIEALRTLNKFPAFEDAVGIDSDEDIREWLFEKIQGGSPCEGLDWSDDVEPWLGDRAAVAAVTGSGDEPVPVFVVQVTDADAAREGFAAIKECGGGGDEGALVVQGDWAVVAESEDVASDVLERAGEESLADDAEFQRWTGEAGDAGIVSMYAAPAVGDYLADHPEALGGLGGLGGSDLACQLGGGVPGLSGDPGGSGTDPYGDLGTDAFPGDGSAYSSELDLSYDECSDESTGSSTELPDEVLGMLRDFEGAAATIRFSDGALEFEAASDGSLADQFGLSGADGTAEAVTSLPADTVAAYGLGFGDDWFTKVVERFASSAGLSPEELIDTMSQASGLDLPEDAEKLAGDSAVLALGAGFDPETLLDSPDGADVPIGLKVQGDADDITEVLAKLQAQAGPAATFLDSSENDGTVAIGPSGTYREALLEDGDLGDDEAFRAVVPEADDASVVFFVDLDQVEGLLQGVDGLGEQQELFDNLEPLGALGASSWVDGDVAHGVFRVSTD